MPLLTYVQLLVAGATFAGLAYGFYTGVLPRWLRSQIGFYELKADVEEVRTNTRDLKFDHEETMTEIETLKNGQLAIARAVDDEHDSVDVDALHDEHYVDSGRPDDFLRGGDHAPNGDD